MVSSSTPGVLQTAIAELGGGGDVDVVVADRHVRDDPQPRRARPQHLGVDAVGEEADDRVDVAGDGVDQLGGR